MLASTAGGDEHHQLSSLSRASESDIGAPYPGFYDSPPQDPRTGSPLSPTYSEPPHPLTAITPDDIAAGPRAPAAMSEKAAPPEPDCTESPPSPVLMDEVGYAPVEPPPAYALSKYSSNINASPPSLVPIHEVGSAPQEPPTTDAL